MPKSMVSKENLLKSKVRFDILCPLESELPNNSKELPHSRKRVSDVQILPGPPPASKVAPMARDNRADDEAVILISNSAVIDAPEEKELPDRYQFELIRLRQRIAELECIVRDRDDRIVKALAAIEDELSFWRSWLHDHIGETMAGISRRVGRLESSLEYLKQKGSRFYPPLEVPAAWKKKG